MNFKVGKVSPSCVLLGNFNPTIFHPAWMEKTQLFREEEIEGATINLIHRDLTIVKISEIDFRIEGHRFQALTVDESKEDLLRDAVAGFFTILAETPLKSIGINWQAHFDLKDEDVWHQLGHILTPKEPWKDVCERPGLKYLRMEGKNPYTDDGNLYITIEPSNAFKYGVRIDMNNHFILKENDGTEQALSILSEYWNDAQKESRERALSLLNCVEDKSE